MIISDDNISFSISTIQECINELNDTDISNKSKYMDILVAERLRKCNDLYIEDYRKNMNKLIEYIEADMVSIRDIPRMMKKVSRNMRSLYVTENAIYSIL